jgi:hypothetical protein
MRSGNWDGLLPTRETRQSKLSVLLNDIGESRCPAHSGPLSDADTSRQEAFPMMRAFINQHPALRAGTPWTEANEVRSLHQTNGIDCGVWAIENGVSLMWHLRAAPRFNAWNARRTYALSLYNRAVMHNRPGQAPSPNARGQGYGIDMRQPTQQAITSPAAIERDMLDAAQAFLTGTASPLRSVASRQSSVLSELPRPLLSPTPLRPVGNVGVQRGDPARSGPNVETRSQARGDMPPPGSGPQRSGDPHFGVATRGRGRGSNRGQGRGGQGRGHGS